MIIKNNESISKTEASFKTHLNYIKCINRLLNGCKISVKKSGTFSISEEDINRFTRLNQITIKSIKKDIELARENKDFAVIIAPWFPVKCYYSLYYLESILINLIDGSNHGFSKGGHKKVRDRISFFVDSNNINFNENNINSVFKISNLKDVSTGKASEHIKQDYWKHDNCINAIYKKIIDYKLYDAKKDNKWDLSFKKDRESKKKHFDSKNVMLLDVFYWYRIKSNYRDLDYIDFENGIKSSDIFNYIEFYNSAFESYHQCLIRAISELRK